MSIKAEEVGRVVNVATTFDLTGATYLAVRLHGPNNIAVLVESPRTSAPPTDYIDPVLGLLPGGTYIQFVTMATDFPEGGDWTACAIYQDATPKEFYGQDYSFFVQDGC